MYIFISDLAEHSQLAEDLGRFTDVRPSRPKLAPRQIVAVSFDGEALHALGRIKHGRKAANYKWHVTLDELTLLDEPLPFSEVSEVLSTTAATAFERAQRAPGKQLKLEVAEEVLEAIEQLRPSLFEVIGRLRRLTTPLEPLRPSSNREPIVAYERDAVGLALEFADLGDFRTSVLGAWDGRTDEPFLNSVPEYSVLEDRAIEHDARVFGDWELVKSGMTGMTRFENHGRRVTIVNVNRAGIERAIGVDLIYYTSEFDAYVVVQYKRRERSDSDERWVFRPDAKFDSELDRMRELVATEEELPEPHGYRLDERCCFLKICSPTTPEAFSSDLASGIYLPLAYWDLLERAGYLRGPKGGRVLTDRIVGRYLTNTLFIDLVKASWVGSRGVTSELISAIVASGLQSNRSLILATSAAAGVNTTGGRVEEIRRRLSDGDSSADELTS